MARRTTQRDASPTRAANDIAPPSVPLRWTPSGQLRLVSSEGVDASLAAAFDRGPGFGLLHLIRTWPSAPLEPSLSVARSLAREYFARLGLSADDDTATTLPEVASDPARLHELVLAMPPMIGAEGVDATILARAWGDLHAATRSELASWHGTLEEWLEHHLPAFHTIGRIVFHLAHNKADPERPFAFMATYAAGLGERGQVRHAPLGRALELHATDRQMLLRILRPLSTAAAEDPWIQSLVERRAVYQPQAWTPDEALALLRVVPVCEAAGIVVRVPPAWAGGRPQRVQVAARVGSRPASTLGLDALLDFDLGLALAGESLTAAEIREVLSGSAGLRLLRGQWVEVDPDRLQRVLARHREIEAMAKAGGVPFAEAMRLFAQANRDGTPADAADERPWSLVEAGPWLAEILGQLRGPTARSASDPGTSLRAELRAYQRDGVAWLWLLYRLGVGGVLADDMGLGKTIQVIALLLLVRREAGSLRALVVCPASLLDNWARELAKFAPSLAVIAAHGSAADPSGDHGDVVLTTYGTLARRAELAGRDWDVVVVDEAQGIKNAATKQARCVKELRARVRIALTGTPVENRPADLWSIFDFACPGLLGTQTAFGRFVKGLSSGSFAPLRELVAPWVLRRLKTDRRIIADLPDKTELEVRCSLSKRQAALYQEATASLARDLQSADDIRRRGLVLAYLQRFKQICNHPSHFLGDGQWREADSGKLLRLREICEEIDARQQKVLVFTQFREMCDPLADRLAAVFGRAGLVLHGEVPVRQRARLVEAFAAEDGPPFFVLSLRAGGTGLNLTAASHVIHFDRWWNPAVEDQATDRAFRIGQHQNVLVHKLVCTGTLEEKIAEMLAAKKGVAQEILSSTGEVALTELSTAELLRIVQLDLARATRME